MSVASVMDLDLNINDRVVRLSPERLSDRFAGNHTRSFVVIARHSCRTNSE
jgi:hypothetical protein